MCFGTFISPIFICDSGMVLYMGGGGQNKAQKYFVFKKR